MQQIFRFYKTPEGRWYIDLPEWTESLSALEMVEGADTMLDKASDFTNECFLELGDENFEGADKIILTENLKDSIGGGYYLMETYKGETINHTMWLCEVTEFVFGYLPEAIYIGYR